MQTRRRRRTTMNRWRQAGGRLIGWGVYLNRRATIESCKTVERWRTRWRPRARAMDAPRCESIAHAPILTTKTTTRAIGSPPCKGEDGGGASTPARAALVRSLTRSLAHRLGASFDRWRAATCAAGASDATKCARSLYVVAVIAANCASSLPLTQALIREIGSPCTLMLLDVASCSNHKCDDDD